MACARIRATTGRPYREGDRNNSWDGPVAHVTILMELVYSSIRCVSRFKKSSPQLAFSEERLRNPAESSKIGDYQDGESRNDRS